MKLIKVTKETLYNDIVKPEIEALERVKKDGSNNEYESGALWDQKCIFMEAKHFYDVIVSKPLKAHR